MHKTCLAAVWLLFAAAAFAAEPEPLKLDAVLAAAESAFPALLMAEQRRLAAEGDVQAAEGGFDTVLKSQNRWSVTGLYENQNYDVVLEQPTPVLGATFFSGWRRGTGDYPVYDGKSLTADDGEMRVGVSVPLWRNREIDRRRATLKQAELAQLAAGHEYRQAVLDIRRQAAHRYWDWLLAGQRLAIAERLLSVAEQRDAGIRDRVAAGDLAEFEALDNQRAIIERRERRVAAQRWLEQSAIQLSLYWRGQDGEPQLPQRSQLPSGFPAPPAPTAEKLVDALRSALAHRPEVQRLEAQSAQAATELELQQNQRAPAVDVSVQKAQDFGSGNKSGLNRDELYVGVNVDIPLQRRTATGRAQSASANLQRLKWERTALENRISAETQDVLSALAAIKQRFGLVSQQQQAAKTLAEGERNRFALGESTLLFVNLRELAYGDAELQVAETQSQWFKSWADYQAVLALDLGAPEDLKR